MDNRYHIYLYGERIGSTMLRPRANEIACIAAESAFCEGMEYADIEIRKGGKSARIKLHMDATDLRSLAALVAL